MGTRTFSQLANRSLCKDEMNLAEFPLAVIGKRPPQGIKTLQFSDQIKHPETGETIYRSLTVTGSDLLGLPTSIDEEVLVGCLKLTKDEGMQHRKVPFTAYQFLEELGWARDGKSYRRLATSLDRWTGTLVISNNAFWHKGKQKLVKDSFGLIDRWKLTDEQADRSHSDKSGWFIWGDFMWESLQAGNIRTLDFGFWKGLENPVSKRLFRLLDKRFYKRNTVTFPLKTLAYDKVGVSRKMHTGQIKETLRTGHRELESKGFCKSTYVKRGRGNWEVVYTDVRKGKGKAVPAPTNLETPSLIKALEDRGIKNGAQLLQNHPVKKVEVAIENFDDRKRHGQNLGPGWLGKCILEPAGFHFRKGYCSGKERAAEAIKKEKAQAMIKERGKLAQESLNTLETSERCRVDAFLQNLPNDKSRASFFDRAATANPTVARYFEKERNSGGKNIEHYRYALLIQQLRRQEEDSKNRKDS